MTAIDCGAERQFGMVYGIMSAVPFPPAVGCLLVTHFSVKAELRRRLDLAGRPLLLTDGKPARRLVVDASA